MTVEQAANVELPYVLPASFGQSRLWLLQELEPDSAAAYVEHVAARMHGPVEIEALQRALDGVVARHEVLRSALTLVDDDPAQVVMPRLDVPITVIDLSDQPERVTDAVRDQLGPFDLTHAPLWRVALVRLGPRDHVLAVAFHHAVYDQWSGAVFLRELLAGYRSATTGGSLELPELPIQYGDFAAWQQGRSGSAKEQGDVDFWQRRLWNLPTLELPVDRPRPATQTHAGATVTGVLSAELVAAVDRLSRQQSATPFMTCLAAFGALLSRWSGQDDVAVGSPIAGRDRLETQGLIGFFVNNLVLRLDLSTDPTFSDLVSRARGTCLEAYAHAELPFERLVEELAPSRNLARSPLFQVMFVFGNVPMLDAAVGELSLEPMRVDPGTAKFDVFFTLVPIGDGMRAVVEYNTALFDPATAERMLDQFIRLLTAGTAEPGLRLSELPLLSDQDRRRLAGWGTGPVEPVSDRTVADLIAARAEAHPGRLAIGCGADVLTYRQFDEAANRVAHYLADRGIRPGDRVAVALPRGIGVVVALVGVLRAGAVYVPVDPDHPAQRLRFVLDDAGISLVLDAALVAEDQALIDACPSTHPGIRRTPDETAYLIYTSGSTGRPKGVAVSHRALVNLLESMAREPGIGPDDVLAAVTTPSFDIAALEMFLPLISGARVEVVPAENCYEGVRLAARLRQCAATLMQATPTTWRLLLDSGWNAPEGFTALCGGEAMSAELARRLVDSGAATWNMYGPTETTVWSSIHRVTGREATVPLGRPIANTVLVVVDQAGNQCPVGVPGELWIGGAGVAEGYWNRPELTAERFVDGPRPGDGRYYRTGDVARYRDDGALEFLGRSDFQVKIRGLRIELGEIESVLAETDGVGEAVVTVREDTPGDPRLVGYLVPVGSGDERQLLAEVRARLRRLVPEHMVPADLVVLDRLPLTPNRKIDRAALPAPDADARAVADRIAPRNDAERAVLDVFAEVLGVDEVGVLDDFFALGGHSLLAARAVARLRKRFGVELPMASVFRHHSAAELAAVLQGPAGPQTPELVPIARTPEPDGSHAGCVLMPTSFQQRRVWFLQQLDPSSAAAYAMHGALRLRGPLDRLAMQRSLDALVARHETLRTGFDVVEDDPVQVVHPGVAVRLEVIEVDDTLTDPSELEGGTGTSHRLAAVLSEHAGRPFDLTRPPLIRVALVRLGELDHVLQVVVHHAVADRVTLEVITGELSAGYRSELAGDSARLPALPVQYGDYAAWQQDWLDSTAVADQVRHLRTVLADLPVLDLPTDRPRPDAQTYRGATRETLIPGELVDRLGTVGEQHQATLFMMLLAGYAVLLSRRSGQEDFAIGSPIDSRDRPELENLVGYLTNNLVLRTDLSGEPTVADLIDRVRATCLDAFGHADVPFERLVEQLAPVRDLSHSPLFQVMFILVHLEAPTLDLPALTVLPVATAPRAAKYELTFTAYPSRGGFRVVAEYNTDLFEAATIDRMLAEYQHVLGQLTQPAELVADIDLLPPAERQALTRWGNGVAMDVPDVSIPALLEPTFRGRADLVAVSGAEGTLTYAELDARANQLAHRLRGMGVTGTGELVGLFLERSPDLVVALLGILRAGAAYLPMEVNFPAERLRYLLEDSAASVVLTQDHLVPLVPETAARVLSMDGDWAATQPSSPLPHQPGPDDLAYVIYTSGSTGRPKGVTLTHRPVVNFLLTMADEPGMRPANVVAAANTVSCDMPVLDLYLPLLVGARIETVPLSDTVDGERLAARMESSGIDYAQGTPTTWRLLQEAGWVPPEAFTALVGAEKVPADLAHWLVGHGARVWHMYGPTETTVWSTVHQVRDEDPLPLGHPVANTELLVLDAGRRRTPIGVPGELYIGGTGLAGGYLHRAELTAERFVADPRDQDCRLYRTGDLVRYTANGQLQFLGRTDFQVKVRGFRIELGEIESALRRDRAVLDAVVVVREDTPGDMRLVGYVVLAGDAGVAGTDGGAVEDGVAAEPGVEERAQQDAVIARLQQSLRVALPAHMVPSAIVVLDHLPLTLNRNKVDRAKLPAPGGVRQVAAVRSEPSTATERAVAAAFAAALGIDQVGVEEDFFQLGGHSLLATRLVGRLLDATGHRLPVRAVFERPTVAGLAELIDKDGQQDSDARIDNDPIVRQVRTPEVGGEFAGRVLLPASFQQRRVWFLDQLAPDSAGAYLMRGALRLKGPLDPQRLQQAVDLVVARHETLRTSLVSIHGEPVQAVDPQLRVLLRRVEIDDLSELASGQALAELLREAGNSVTSLAQAPLIEITLVRLAPEDHALVVVAHHAISDRLSTEILVGELAAAYRDQIEGNDTRSAEPPVQYGDYSQWQRDRLSGRRLAAEVAYWGEQLADLPVLELPTDRPRPPVQTHSGQTRTLPLPSELVDGLRQVAADNDATLFMVLLSGFAAVLHRMSGQDDLAIGTPDSGRSHPQLAGTVGYLANTLVLRSVLPAEARFTDLLAGLRNTCLDAYDHAEVPFDKLVEELRPARDLSRSPLFQVLFIQMPLPPPVLSLPGIEAAPLDIPATGAKFDLTLIAQPAADSGAWTLALEYNSDLFEQLTADLVLRRTLGLLTAVVAEPGCRLADVPLPEPERAALTAWGTGDSREVPTACLPELFEAQARRVPERVAVRCGDTALTFQGLNDRANRLARRLRSQGVGVGTVVALATERSVETFIGILAVLKAGGAYLPIEPSYPAERIAFQLADSRAAILLSTGPVAEGLPAFSGQLILIEDQASGAVPDSEEAAGAVAGPDDLAYVIYTSGSTGRPKGVAIRHRSLVNLLTAMADTHGITERDMIAVPTTPAFDLSVPDLHLPLVTGATAEIIPALVAADGPALRDQLHHAGVTFLQATPTTWRLVLDAGWRSPARFTAICGGEAVPAELAHRLREAGATVWHYYGPTEATVWTMAHRVEDGEDPLPLGRPLPNTELRVLDATGRACPIGVPGELWIGGTGLAAGYLHQPELTEERFRSPVPGSGRLYRTGDIGRFSSAGTLEFLGRADHQVKVRGFRIELGEVEAVLREHPLVRDAAVLVRDGANGEPALVAYLQPDPGVDAELPVADILGAAGRRLPGYMVPRSTVVLAEFPLTSNLKVDRARLPQPAERGAIPSGGDPAGSGAPRGQAQQRLAALFASTLGVQAVAVDDDFFALGGHSLLAAKLHADILDAWPDAPPVRVIFENPTVASLARVLEESDRTGLEGAGRTSGADHPLDAGARPDGGPEADVELPAEIRPATMRGWRGPAGNVLLTGATGFLGTFLLARLLSTAHGRVTALVRAADADQAMSRLRARLAEFGLLDTVDLSRLRALPGDLSAPQLGLDAATFASLAETADLIIHSGAQVNYTLPYGHLRAANVEGTKEVLRLAAAGTGTPVHLVSSRAVFGRADGQVLLESDQPQVPPYDDNGYAQTKWVAERLAETARSRGLPIAVHRPGRISGDSVSGIWRGDDVAVQLLRACAVVGLVPDTDLATDLVPVDRLAAAIVGLAGREESLGGNFHFAAPRKTPIRLIENALHVAGFSARLAPVEQWYEAVRAHVRADPDAGLALVVSEYGPLLRAGDTWQEPRFDCTNTESHLAGEAFPEVGVELLARYLRSMVDTGLLAEPLTQRQHPRNEES